jgi:hypothetical protein
MGLSRSFEAFDPFPEHLSVGYFGNLKGAATTELPQRAFWSRRFGLHL